MKNFRLHAPEEDDIVANINTTPLVDVMLVLLIIFLITIPVVVHTHRVNLPKEMTHAQPLHIEDINVAVTREGHLFWKDQPITENALKEKLTIVNPQTVHLLVRADELTPYHFIGALLHDCNEAGINQIEFITDPSRSHS